MNWCYSTPRLFCNYCCKISARNWSFKKSDFPHARVLYFMRMTSSEQGDLPIESTCTVWISRPYLYGHARIYEHLWKIARIFVILPVFLWFCPYFCDFVQVQSVINILIYINILSCLANRSITFWMCTKSKKDDNITNLNFACIFARIFAKNAPVFLQKWARMKQNVIGHRF